ncbi:MAG: hypothetical protein J6V52_00030 [Bacteroidaceae bacterium]|nr:hypothetical protein [Bacteroidaceae bacterium]
MNILVACEESQAVTIELRKLGHNAFSCDIIECSGGHPEWHIKQDVLPLINGRCSFMTCDGQMHTIDGKWDMIYFFPPCTFLTNTGNRWFNVERYGEKAVEREKNRQEAAEFFMAGWNADCDRVVIENPIGYMSTYFRKPDQIVHPYYFAEEENDENCERKATCIWYRGVGPIEYQVRFQPRVIEYKNGKGTDSPWHMETMKLPPEERAKARSKTFPGVARALADLAGEAEG